VGCSSRVWASRVCAMEWSAMWWLFVWIKFSGRGIFERSWVSEGQRMASKRVSPASARVL